MIPNSPRTNNKIGLPLMNENDTVRKVYPRSRVTIDAEREMAALDMERKFSIAMGEFLSKEINGIVIISIPRKMKHEDAQEMILRMNEVACDYPEMIEREGRDFGYPPE